MRVKGRTTCQFCDQVAFATRQVQPARCEKHHELMMMVSYARRRNMLVTVANLVKLHQNTPPTFRLQQADIRPLLEQIKQSWKHQQI